MLGAAMQAPLAGLALTLELTHGGFALLIPMIVTTVTATVIARKIDGYSIYTARLGADPDVSDLAAAELHRAGPAGRDRAEG